MSNSRLEKFIYAICGMEVDDLPTPLSRIETLWNCLITGEVPDFEPLSRNEKYLMAMLNGDVDGLPEPTSQSEKLLYKIATGETDLSDVPGYLSRYEELLKQLIENGGIGGTDFEYVLYTLNQPLSTLYSTAEAPVKSAILTGNTETIIDKFEQGTINTWNGTSFPKPDSTTRIRLKNIIELKQDIIIGVNDKYELSVQTSDKNVYGWSSQISFANNGAFIIAVRKKDGSEIVPSDILGADFNINIPHFTDMQSVKMPVLTTTGKNLFDKSMLIEPSKWTGIWSEKLNLTDFKLKRGETYYFDVPYRIRWMKDETVVLEKQFGVKKASTIPLDYDEVVYDIYIPDMPLEDYKNTISSSYITYGASPTQYEPYKTNILTTTSKNLFDMNRPYDVITDSQATVVQDTNQITVSSAESGTYVNANFILDKDFFAGKTVTGSCLYESDENDIGTVQITYQDGDGVHHYQWIKTPKTFTFPNSFIGDVMLSVSANNTGTPQSNTVTVKNIQLELGSTATSYEPYSEVTLRGIGDVKDTLDLITGELTQRIGEVVLDGSMVYNKYVDVNGFNTCGFYTSVPGGFSNHITDISKLLCDKLKSSPVEKIQPNLSGITDEEGLCVNGGVIKFRIDGNKASTVEELKAYLSENPIKLTIPLSQDVIKTVVLSTLDQDGQPTKLSTFNDITHVSIEAEDLLPTVDLEVPTKIEETLSTLPTLMNDISETQQLLNESIDDQAENINEVSIAITEIRSDIL